MRTNVDRNALASHGRDLVPPILLVTLAVGVSVVLVLGWSGRLSSMTALAWGLALYVSGALIGFLFGIPKVPDRSGLPAVSPDVPSAAGGATTSSAVKKVVDADARRLSGINSNLVEVSDWLTKIIVGVGLVELKNLSTHGESLARFIALSLVPPGAGTGAAGYQNLTSIGGAIALFFGVLGFITGYLLTRIFLAVIMNDADRSAEEASSWRLSGGDVVDTPTMLGGLKSAVDDLQAKFIEMLPRPGPADAARDPMPAASAAPGLVQTPDASRQDPGDATTVPDDAASTAQDGPQPGAATALPATPLPTAGPLRQSVQPPLSLDIPPLAGLVRTVLWVDDKPSNNALLVDRLRGVGVKVDQALTTADALDKLKRREYDIVITDMHRGENVDDGVPSGIRLIVALRKPPGFLFPSGRKPLLFVYCSKGGLLRYGKEAQEKGADFVSASEIEVLGLLSRVYPGLT